MKGDAEAVDLETFGHILVMSRAAPDRVKMACLKAKFATISCPVRTFKYIASRR